MTADESNPYRFAAVEVEREEDAAASIFRQPAEGRKLSAIDVRRLAISQRALVICTAIVAPYALVTATVPRPRPQNFVHLPAEAFYAVMFSLMIVGCVVALAFIAGLFFVFAVGRRTHPTLLALLFTLLAFLPPLCVPIYLYLHFRANYVLKRHGVPVGWLGAKLRSLPKADAQPIVESSPA